MKRGKKFFDRKCKVVDPSGSEFPLTITFYAPVKYPLRDEYISIANVNCQFFERNILGIGSDASQSFFALPMLVVCYLLGRRGDGFEAYWLGKGDLDYDDFWLYREKPRSD